MLDHTVSAARSPESSENRRLSAKKRQPGRRRWSLQVLGGRRGRGERARKQNGMVKKKRGGARVGVLQVLDRGQRRSWGRRRAGGFLDDEMIVQVSKDKVGDDDEGAGPRRRWGRDSGGGQEMKERTKRRDGARG